MKNNREFTVPGEPVGKGRPRFVRATGRTYTPEKTVNYENLVKMAYLMECDGMFEVSKPLTITIDAYFQIPKSFSKKKHDQAQHGEIRPIKKPDLDNVVKCICDALNGIAYHDDSQIVDCFISKWYSDEPRVRVRIEEA